MNILIYVVNSDDPRNSMMLDWWAANLNSQTPIGFAWSVIVGFLRFSTLPRAFATPLSPEQAMDRLNQWLNHPNTQIVSETTGHWSTLQDCIRQTGTAGNLATDAHLAALAISRGATLVSCDTDFARFRHLRWENPLV